jgi:hypothetical protein
MGLLEALKKRKERAAAKKREAAARHNDDSRPCSSESCSDGDERVHSFEIGQEDYLVQVALATSAQDYAGGGGSQAAARRVDAAPGAAEASWKYWREQRCVPRVTLRPAAIQTTHGVAHAWLGWTFGCACAATCPSLLQPPHSLAAWQAVSN